VARYVGDTASVELLPAAFGQRYSVTVEASVTSPSGVAAPLVVQWVNRRWVASVVLTEPGQWLVRWVSTGASTVETVHDVVEAIPAPVPVSLADWAPGLAQIAALLSARFHGALPSATTVPTDTQVAETIARVQREVATAVEYPMTAQWVTYAQDTAALGVAAYIENGAFPEQNETLDVSGQAEFFRRRYQEHTAALRANMRGYVVA
jgi:hypothetical protein